MTRALILGRFQPTHLGHLHAMRKAREAADDVVVIVGSAQESHTEANPFTAGERVEMLEAAIAEARLENVRVYPVADLNRNSQWVAHVESLVPRFDVVVTNNPLTKMLFSEAGYKVVEVELFRRNACSGTQIRRRLADGKSVEDLVPGSVAAILKRIRAPDRLRALAGRGHDR